MRSVCHAVQDLCRTQGDDQVPWRQADLMVGIRRDLASRLFQREDGYPGVARAGLGERQVVQVSSGPDALRRGSHPRVEKAGQRGLGESQP